MSRTGTAVAVLLGTLLLSQAALARHDSGSMGVTGRVRDAGAMTALTVPRFTSPAWIEAGKNPFRLVATDLNGDGKADLAAVNWTAATVTVTFGDGKGQFGPRTAYRTGRRPEALVASDLNGDGKLDLAVASKSAAESITVLLNRGGGRFRHAGAYAVGRDAYGLAAGDVNGDGVVDLLSAHANRKCLAVLLGRRGGGFRVAHRYSGGSAYDLAVADLNGDGKLDVVLADDGHRAATVRLGRGDGTFGPPHSYRSGLTPFGVAVADLNHDGTLDLTVANYGEGHVSVFIGAGNGSFGRRSRYAMGDPEDYEEYVDTVLVADFDRDGHPDIVTPGGNPNIFIPSGPYLRRGRGDGTFDARQSIAFAYTQAGAVADFNNDGWPDLAFSEACDEAELDCDEDPSLTIAVLLNWTGQPVAPCVVPLLVNPVPYFSASERRARRLVVDAGCRVGRVRHQYSRTGRKGTVIRQRPKPGAVLANNSPVNFVISRGRRH